MKELNVNLLENNHNITAFSDQLEKIEIKMCTNCHFNISVNTENQITLVRLTNCVINVKVKKGVKPMILMSSCDTVRIVSVDDEHGFWENAKNISIVNSKNIVVNEEMTSVEELRLVGCSECVFNLKPTMMKGMDIVECDKIVFKQQLKQIQSIKVASCKRIHMNMQAMNDSRIGFERCSTCHLEMNVNNTPYSFYEMNNCQIDFRVNEGEQQSIPLIFHKCKNSTINPLFENVEICFDECHDIQLNNRIPYKYIGLINSNIVTEGIHVKEILLDSIETQSAIDLSKVKKIELMNLKDYAFENEFNSCEKLSVIRCENCDIKLNEQEKKTIKEITWIGNKKCPLPEHHNIVDSEPLKISDVNDYEMNDLLFVCDENNLVIKNANQQNICVISTRNSNITFEHCKG